MEYPEFQRVLRVEIWDEKPEFQRDFGMGNENSGGNLGWKTRIPKKFWDGKSRIPKGFGMENPEFQRDFPWDSVGIWDGNFGNSKGFLEFQREFGMEKKQNSKGSLEFCWDFGMGNENFKGNLGWEMRIPKGFFQVNLGWETRIPKGFGDGNWEFQRFFSMGIWDSRLEFPAFPGPHSLSQFFQDSLESLPGKSWICPLVTESSREKLFLYWLLDREAPEVPALAGHSLTPGGSRGVFLVGGFSPQNGFNTDLLVFDPLLGELAGDPHLGDPAHRPVRALGVAVGVWGAAIPRGARGAERGAPQPEPGAPALEPAGARSGEKPRPLYFHAAAVLGEALGSWGGAATAAISATPSCSTRSCPPTPTRRWWAPPRPGRARGAPPHLGGLQRGGLGGLWALRVPPEPCGALPDPGGLRRPRGWGAPPSPPPAPPPPGTPSSAGACGAAANAWPSTRWGARVPTRASGAGTAPRAPASGRAPAAAARTIAASTSARSEAACGAPDCQRCARARRCVWTRQFKRTGETRRILSVQPSSDRTCFSRSLLNVSPMPVESAPPLPCPRPCHLQRSCHACLSSPGADGGWSHCLWSLALSECLSPSLAPLRCLLRGGGGGASSAPSGTFGAGGGASPGGGGGAPERCPPPPECAGASQCSQCLRRPRCGWCARAGHNGGGRCLEGGLSGPRHGVTQACGAGGVWAFLSCPPEDECENGHHTCGPSQVCRDLADGFTCACRAGYAMDSRTGECRPVCRQGCANGTCLEPDRCRCHFGFVGGDCATPCACNGHSDCAGPMERDACLRCMNNTQGPQCQQCRPGFVGSALSGGSCLPCRSFCRGRADVCLSRAHLERHRRDPARHPLEAHLLHPWVPEGPSEAQAVCVNCQDNSVGDRCDTCRAGFFMLDGTCTRCQCNGHADTCNELDGTGCPCQNNTESGACPERRDCYRHRDPVLKLSLARSVSMISQALACGSSGNSSGNSGHYPGNGPGGCGSIAHKAELRFRAGPRGRSQSEEELAQLGEREELEEELGLGEGQPPDPHSQPSGSLFVGEVPPKWRRPAPPPQPPETLTFLQLDIDHYVGVPPRGFPGWPRPSPILRMLGVTGEGRSGSVRLRGFSPTATCWRLQERWRRTWSRWSRNWRPRSGGSRGGEPQIWAPQKRPGAAAGPETEYFGVPGGSAEPLCAGWGLPAPPGAPGPAAAGAGAALGGAGGAAGAALRGQHRLRDTVHGGLGPGRLLLGGAAPRAVPMEGGPPKPLRSPPKPLRSPPKPEFSPKSSEFTPRSPRGPPEIHIVPAGGRCGLGGAPGSPPRGRLDWFGPAEGAEPGHRVRRQERGVPGAAAGPGDCHRGRGAAPGGAGAVPEGRVHPAQLRPPARGHGQELRQREGPAAVVCRVRWHRGPRRDHGLQHPQLRPALPDPEGTGVTGAVVPVPGPGAGGAVAGEGFGVPEPPARPQGGQGGDHAQEGDPGHAAGAAAGAQAALVLAQRHQRPLPARAGGGGSPRHHHRAAGTSV
ncbi:uncharacterized protein LOC141728024 isoform X2 [Zonotrichia albicollis]|uniref:uncharacterized protein LOC141728024 isoform X2 n=1 Tax=Zonotrichia albicollis TaxID=44394 RepID=UPI003D811525